MAPKFVILFAFAAVLVGAVISSLVFYFEPMTVLSGLAKTHHRVSNLRIKWIGPGEGHIYLRKKSNEVFLWGRLVGPAIVGIEFNRNGTGSFYLPIQGRYRLSVISTFPVSSEGSAEYGTTLYTDLQETNNTIIVGGGFGHRNDSSYVYFTSKPEALSILNLRDTRPVFGYSAEQYTNITGLTHHFLDGRSLRKECVAGSGGLVCVIGDSHMRFLANELMYYLDETRDYLKMAKKAVAESSSIRYYQARWFHEIAALLDSGELAICGSVFLNFGLWPLSYQVKEQGIPPYTLERYAGEISQVAARISGRVNYYWLTIEPSNVASHPAHAPYEFRHISIVELWNARAKQLLLEADVRVIDVYKMLLPISDLTVDSDHRTRPMLDCVVEAVFRGAFPACLIFKK